MPIYLKRLKVGRHRTPFSDSTETRSDGSVINTLYGKTNELQPMDVPGLGNKKMRLSYVKKINGELVSERYKSKYTSQKAKGTDHTWRYTYDAAGNLLSAEDPLQQQTTYQWDATGNLITVTGPNTAQTTLAYNALNQPVSQTNHSGRITKAILERSSRTYTFEDGRQNQTRVQRSAGRHTVTRAETVGKWGDSEIL